MFQWVYLIDGKGNLIAKIEGDSELGRASQGSKADVLEINGKYYLVGLKTMYSRGKDCMDVYLHPVTIHGPFTLPNGITSTQP